MKAIGYSTPGAIDGAGALQDIDLPRPSPGPHDLLVKVAAISVNPVDTKVRRAVAPEAGQWKVLGWDAVGQVEAWGPRSRALPLEIASGMRALSRGRAPMPNIIWWMPALPGLRRPA